jgi:alkylation response protein AidB-like acyl-CoA dehydrogenase
MGTLDSFRTTVGAAALGFARRALDEALQRARSASMFGRTLADFQLTQKKLGEMAGHRRLRADGLPRGLDQGRAGPARHPRGVDGQADRHRVGATGDRCGGAAVRRLGRGAAA